VICYKSVLPIDDTFALVLRIFFHFFSINHFSTFLYLLFFWFYLYSFTYIHVWNSSCFSWLRFSSICFLMNQILRFCRKIIVGVDWKKLLLFHMYHLNNEFTWKNCFILQYLFWINKRRNLLKKLSLKE